MELVALLAKHRIYKLFLNCTSRLCEVFKTFKELEEREISCYKEEIKTFSMMQNKKLNEHELISESSKIYGKYAIEKLKQVFLKSTNYDVEVKGPTLW